MKAGKSMKAAARSWRGGKSKPRKRVAPKAKRRSVRSRVKTGGRKVAKGGFNSQKIMKLIRTVALVAPVASAVMSPVDNAEKVDMVIRSYTGYSPKYRNFAAERLAQGWMPYIAAVGVTYGIPKLAGMIRGI